ncbi:uncharacterized protein LOC110874138 [Helianthus annuus]|uniref:uncharacterized protein LOC110874138 n=1 Tax=Helianthus annuus TaxID=4232 RepID=UPI000B8FDD14|nr:uncharacterized protein LOC110874138 [Helianthus annuus]
MNRPVIDGADAFGSCLLQDKGFKLLVLVENWTYNLRFCGVQLWLSRNFHYKNTTFIDHHDWHFLYVTILYSELLNMLLEGRLDVTILHWFAMHFFESLNSRCAFFNPQKITGSQCKTFLEDVKKNVKEICELHSKKVFYLASYLAGKYWSLIIVCPDFKFGNIVDSIRKGRPIKITSSSRITEEVFEINFKWHMAQCKQQKGSCECGYMVIKHMKEFIDSIQHDLVNRLWNEEGYFEESQIENLVVDLMSGFIKKMF